MFWGMLSKIDFDFDQNYQANLVRIVLWVNYFSKIHEMALVFQIYHKKINLLLHKSWDRSNSVPTKSRGAFRFREPIKFEEYSDKFYEVANMKYLIHSSKLLKKCLRSNLCPQNTLTQLVVPWIQGEFYTFHKKVRSSQSTSKMSICPTLN